MAEPAGRDEGEELHAIQSVADELGMTARALRFYESKGLIEPQRVGSMRAYSKRERGRLQLIQRGKRLGFSIREIKEFLDLYDADPQHIEQMRRLAERAIERIAKLEEHKSAIDQTIGELHVIVAQARRRVSEAEDSGVSRLTSAPRT